MAQVVIALGSNEGDRLGMLRAGLKSCRALCEPGHEHALLKSAIFETEPVGPADAPFLNAVVSFACQLPPDALLAALKKTEAEQGRNFKALRWSNRPLDLDIISYGTLILGTPALTIPHLRCHERAFVLQPLHEILPGWRHPQHNQTAAELLARAPKMQVYKTALMW